MLSRKLFRKRLAPSHQKYTSSLQAVNPRFDSAFTVAAQRRPGALIVAPDSFFDMRREHLIRLSKRHAIPTPYHNREFVAAAGLMSYGTSIAYGYRQTGIYAGRILKGEKPADLPVIESARFDFAINLKTARTLG